MTFSFALGTHLSELHTGYRAYSRELLMTVPFLRKSLDYSFDSELLMQATHFGFRIAEVPTSSRYFDDASSIAFGPAAVYGLRPCGWSLGCCCTDRGIWRSRRLMP